MTELRAQMTRYSARQRMAAHADGLRRLSVLVAGAQEEKNCRRSESAEVGSVALKGPELVHRNQFGDDGAIIVSVLLPDEALTALGHRTSSLPAWKWQHDDDTRLTGLRLASALRRSDVRVVEECIHDLLGEFTPRVRERIESPERLQRIRDRLHDFTAPTPSVRELAAAEGMHPVSLGRVFRRAFGCSITHYRQRTRAAAVARALAREGESLVGVAHDHGFSDLSHMSRVFRRELSVPPGTYWRSLRPPDNGLESFKTQWSVTI